MKGTRLTVRSVRKSFNGREIINGISFEAAPGHAVAITGRNGSGKSTLCKLISRVLTPSRGEIVFTRDGGELGLSNIRRSLGFVSPYLQLYDELTGMENIELLSAIRDGGVTPMRGAEELFSRFGIYDARNEPVRAYSSGMKQRLKYVFALAHNPAFLILDEPTSNLDSAGATIVAEVCADIRLSSVLVVATNDADEAQWCDEVVALS